MPVGRIGMLVSLLILITFWTGSPARGDLVLPRIETYVTSNFDLNPTSPIPSDEKAQSSPIVQDAQGVLAARENANSNVATRQSITTEMEVQTKRKVAEMTAEPDRVPEPGSIHLIALGLLLFAGRRRRVT